MTVCIAAMSSLLGAVVTVTDFMLSDEFSSVESRQIKIETVANTWHCLYAGDPSLFAELAGHIENDLRSMGGIPSCGDVILAVEKAYEAALAHRIERRILAPFGMTRSKFLQTGMAIFDPETFRRITLQMEDRNLFVPGAELLITGFDSEGKAHIISRHVAMLDRLAVEIRLRHGVAMSRTGILRAIVEAAERNEWATELFGA